VNGYQSDYTSFNGNNYVIDMPNEMNNGDTHGHANRATRFYLSNSAAGTHFGALAFVADINSDTVPDLLISGSLFDATAVYGNGPTYGYGNRWPKNQDIYNQSATHGFSVASNIYTTKTPAWLNSEPFVTAFDINGDNKPDLLLSYTRAKPVVGGTTRNIAGATLVIYQPSGGWGTNLLQYYNFKWDGTDSFQIYGPAANNYCGTAGAVAGDVRPGDNNKPEIMINCSIGKTGYGAVYGLYKNKGWPSSIDLNKLN
jgi:hypothetical protein